MKKTNAGVIALTAASVAGLLCLQASAASAVAGGGTLRVLSGSYPDYVDPSVGNTVQYQEAVTPVYIPLLTYARRSGVAGTQVIPGLATALPKVSANGLIYRLTLRKGVRYSTGAPVVASDFAFAAERAIKLQWADDAYITQYVRGANDYTMGKATSISGIQTDNATGAITITLTQAYGAFDNVLAFEQLAPLPSSTPMKVQATAPPAGDGPYTWGKIIPNVSYTLNRNPRYRPLPGLPAGRVARVVDTVNSNNTSEAHQVISGGADVFDPADTLPPAEVSAAKALPSSRYQVVPAAETNFIFLNTRTAPFNNLAVRRAVETAIDRTAFTRLAAGFSAPTCYLLPPDFPGHPSASCPGGDPNKPPSPAVVAKAKAAIAKAGLRGSPVTVWSQTKSPRQQYMTYYTSFLNSIGLKATLKVIADATYFQQIGAASNDPQTGFVDWTQDFPNPSDFYQQLDANAIHATNNENFSNVDDPHIQAALKRLDPVPSANLASVDRQWAALDEYVTQQAYIVPFGNQTVPLLFSSRVANGPASFNSVFHIDYETIALR